MCKDSKEQLGSRHSERHCKYSMMEIVFLLEVQETSLHRIPSFTRGTVESTWATITHHRLVSSFSSRG